MENITYIGLSHQLALRRQMDIIANNIANSTTTGFRGEKLLFEEFLIATTRPLKASFVSDFGTLRYLDAGPLETTGNPLDVAISGAAYFVADTLNGERYTRNGHFRLDPEGQLITAEGDPVVDDAGQPIVIDPSQGKLTITPDGAIANPLGPIAKLQLVTFANEQNLRKVANSYYLSDDPPLPAEGASVIQGMLEKSNVEPIVEMTRMIEVSRNYQATKGMVDSQHELQRRAIERLSRIRFN